MEKGEQRLRQEIEHILKDTEKTDRDENLNKSRVTIFCRFIVL
jgi:hypothetical protein